MEELVSRVAAAANLSPDIAQRAVSMVLAFLKQEGPPDEVGALFAAMPGSKSAAEDLAGDTESGGGLMGLAGRLTSLGLGLPEMQAVGQQVFAYAREKAGDERVGSIVGAIPGASQFL